MARKPRLAPQRLAEASSFVRMAGIGLGWFDPEPSRCIDGSPGQPTRLGLFFLEHQETRLVFGVGLACTGISQKPRSPARVAGASCYDLAKYESIVGVMPRIFRSSPRSFRGYWAFRFLRSQSVRGAPIVPVSGASLKTIDNANISSRAAKVISSSNSLPMA